MMNEHGDFVWYELMTSDAESAQTFYGGLLGWSFEDSGHPDRDYRLFSADGVEVGGLLQLTEEMRQGGAAPMWAGYLEVDDLDKAMRTIDKAGGRVLMGPMDVPNVGRLAYVTDSQGAPFYVMHTEFGQPSQSFAQTEPRVGHCAWNELSATDPEAALAFYANAFGWIVAERMDMGPIGEYQMLKNGESREFMFGAVMKKPDEVPMSMWSFYFRVPSIDTAVRYLNDNNATIINGPMEIPGGEFSLNAVDPQGAFFALVGQK